MTIMHSQFMNKVVSEIGCYRLVPLFRSGDRVGGDGPHRQLERARAHLCATKTANLFSLVYIKFT